eukprot:13621141-Ditylum_brightwellii.AAC.1
MDLPTRILPLQKEIWLLTKNHLGGMVRKKSVAIEHGDGVAGSAKSAAFVLDNVLVKQQVLAREEIIAREFTKLSTLCVCSAVGDVMHFGQNAGSAEENIAGVGAKLVGADDTRARIGGITCGVKGRTIFCSAIEGTGRVYELLELMHVKVVKFLVEKEEFQLAGSDVD